MTRMRRGPRSVESPANVVVAIGPRARARAGAQAGDEREPPIAAMIKQDMSQRRTELTGAEPFTPSVPFEDRRPALGHRAPHGCRRSRTN